MGILLGYKIKLNNLKRGDLQDLKELTEEKECKAFIDSGYLYLIPGTNSLKLRFNKYLRLLRIRAILQEFGLLSVAQPVRF